MALQIMTGNAPLPKPYTSHTIVLNVIITIIDKFRSPTLFVFHACSTCGINVMLLNAEPMRPVTSIQSMNVKVVSDKL